MHREMEAQDADTPRVGLALGGGGARGLAHIGVLKILEREGIPVHCIAGTSIGGIIAAACAVGLKPDFLEEEALRMASPRQLLRLADLGMPQRGFLEGQKVYAYLAGLLGAGTFENAQLPVAMTAVDLKSGRRLYLCEGPLLEAVRATIAFPGVFKPVEREGQLLVDGGLLDNLPTDAARTLGADVVIAVDVTAKEAITSLFSNLQQAHYVPSGLVETMEVLWRSIAVMMTEIEHQCMRRARPDLVIRPDIPSDLLIFTGFTRAEEAIEAGIQATEEALPQIRDIVGRDQKARAG